MAVLKKCRGLITDPNELYKDEGALEVADNVVIDADDTIEIRNGFLEFGDAFGNDSDRLKQLFVYKNRILRHYNQTLQYDSTGQGSFQDFDGSFTETEQGLRVKGLESKGNFYFTTSTGIKKISAKTASDFTTASNYIENAGIPKAVDMKADLLPVAGGFLPPESKVAYRVFWGKKDLNNNLLLGSPSGREILINNSKSVITPEQFTVTFTGASEANVEGKYILFSTSTQDYYVWFKSPSALTPPQTSETVGRTPLEADVSGIGSASATIAAIFGNAVALIGSQVSVLVSGASAIVTNEEGGEDVQDAAIQTGGITNVTLNINAQGQVTEGTSSNATITVTIPPEIDSTDYFFQVYRTAVTTVTTGLTLDDLEPGDELNLVYEANVTNAEITAGTVTFEDITTEDFRASSAFAYTNANTGTGILSANERPPIAKDIASFRNSVFYANTKSLHRLEFNLLSVLDFTSGFTNFIIGNSNVTREYTFVGETEVFEIETDTFANTTANSYILANSARNERKYYFWFDKGGGTDPAVPGRLSVRVDISLDTTADDVATSLFTAINSLPDFTATVLTNTITVTVGRNGETDDAVFGAVAPGGSWTITIITDGEGEDLNNQEVVLSSFISVGQAIDETARSLVRVINRDLNSPVIAEYLSGPDDVPGIISLQNKAVEDNPFYIATNDPNIKTKFDPALTAVETITAISQDNPTQITSAGHGLVNGDSIYIYNTDSTPAIIGEYKITFIDANTFSVPVNVTTAGTTGLWFLADNASDNETTPNRLYFSKIQQPEAVPLVNFIDIGAQDKEIRRILPLRDSLVVMKDDGVYIITGTTAPNFGSRLLDSTVKIQAPDSAVVLNNQIYALSFEGIVAITESGARIISRNIENKINVFLNNNFSFKTTCFGVAYDFDKCYYLWAPTKQSDTIGTQCYRYNTTTDTWTRWTKEATCGIVNDNNNKLYLGSGTRNYTDEERKNNDRTDKSDRDFMLQLPANSYQNETIFVSNAIDLAIGDVILQRQYLTISKFNAILRKLDLDPGMESDYETTLKLFPGLDLQNATQDLVDKLVLDDASGSVTSKIIAADFETIQEQFNDTITELNLPGCDTSFKNYKESDGTVAYEAIITKIKKDANQITLETALPLLVGNIQAFKGIKMTAQWAPQDFGKADLLKQVREGTILFDQNNFYGASVFYASDLSQNFEEISFLGRRNGDWGSFTWGEVEWGGNGSEVPVRTLIPQQKQRCRFIKVKFQHLNAREVVRIIGISLEPRQLSTRGYR